jgi:hypothetical protein
MSMARQVLQWLREKHPTLELAPNDIQEWMADLENHGYSQWTCHHHLTKLRLLLDQAVRLSMIRENPARAASISISQPKHRQDRYVLSEEEIEKLLEASLDFRQRINGYLPTVARLGLYAGLRNEEMAWCQCEWINWKHSILARRPSFPGDHRAPGASAGLTAIAPPAAVSSEAQPSFWNISPHMGVGDSSRWGGRQSSRISS